MSLTDAEKELVLSSSWLAGIDAKVQQAVLDVCSVKHFAAGDLVHSEGGLAGGLYFIAEGRLRICTYSFHGHEVVFTILRPGHWSGEVSASDKGPRATESKAVVDTKLIMISADNLHRVAEQYTELYPRLMAQMAGSFRRAGHEIQLMLCLSPEQRLAWRLSEAFEHERVGDAVMFTQPELSALAGFSRQKVNRHLHRWEEQGIVERHYGRIRVLDIEALNDIWQ